ncbi:DUF6884 domain-containing protein [Halobaculum sp. MBLA0147]|uniref:DUF6884 domain-containing protein n=1 Tax=Halobaculum sp. MBLA0147 TaxID=3079934 RepID=UPI003524A5EC
MTVATPPGLVPESSTIHGCLVGCGDAKADEARPAAELYTSQYFQKKRAFAEKLVPQYWILSAEHGVVDPATEIEPYDTRVGGNDFDRQAFLSTVADDMASLTDDDRDPTRLIVLTGEDYLTALIDALARADTGPGEIKLVTPFRHGSFEGIGDQMSYLNAALEAGDQTLPVADALDHSPDHHQVTLG